MANQNIKIGLLITADGANQTVRSLQQIQAELDKMKVAAKQSAIAQSQAATQLAQSLGTSYKNAQQFAQSLGLTAEKAQGAVQRLGELDRAGASAAEKFRALGREFGVTRQQFEGLNASFNQNTRAQEGLARSLGVSIDGARNFAKDIGLSAGKAGEAVGRYRELSAVGATLAEKQRVLTQELGLTSKQFDAVRGAALSSQQGLAGITAVAGGVAAALGNIANQGIKAFVEFDAAIRTFGVISEGSSAQVGAVRDEIERLGTTSTKTPKEVATLSIELAKAGFKAEQVKAALGGVVLASQATGEDLQRTGEVVGNVINQFQLKASDSAKIADLLVATSNASASGVNDLGEALSYVGTASAQSGQSLKDTLFALGQLANAGIKGSSAGTGLAEALRRLKLASANASTELADLKSKGAKTAIAAFNKVNEAVRDTNGQLLPLPQVLKNLQAGLQGVGQVDKDLIMNALFGVQGGRVVQSLIAGNAEQVNGLKDALDNSNGAAMRAGEALSQGPQAAMQRLQAATSVALVSIGEFVSMAFLPLIDVSQLLLGTFNALPGPLQALVMGVGGVAAALAAATAAVATYNLAQGATIVQETLAAAATVRDTLVKGASTAATQIAIIAQRALALSNATVTAATIAQTFATGQKNILSLIDLRMTVQGTAATIANTTARLANSVAVRAGISAVLGLSVAVGGLILLFQDLTTKTPTDEFTEKVRQSTEALAKLRNEAAKPAEKGLIDDLGDRYNRFLANVQNKGAIDALRAAISDLQAAVAGGGDSTSQYGEEWRVATKEQVANRAAQVALEEQFTQTNATIDGSRALIAKYGLAQVDAADKTRLGTQGIAEFQAAGAKQIKGIEQSIELLTKQKDAATNDEQRNQIQTQINLLEGSKAALQKRAQQLTEDTKALKTNTDAAKVAGKAQEDLKAIVAGFESGKSSADGAVDQLAEIAGNADAEVKVKKEAADAIVKIRQEEINAVQQALDTGTQSEADAIAKLQAIQASSAVSPAATKAAGDAVLKIRKGQTDAEIATIQAGISAVEALQAQGNLSEVAADQQVTQLKIAEIQKRIEANRAAANSATGSERTKLLAEEKKLQGDIDKLKAEAANKERKRRVEDFDERLKVLQAGYDQGKVAEGDYLKQKTQLQIQQADEEIKQQREALAKLGANDKEGREAITAKIADIESKKAKAIADGLKAQIALVDRFVQEGQAKASAAEAGRLVDIQKLANAGTISQQQAEELKANATRDRLQTELNLAQQQIQKLAALPNPTNPEAARELENKKQAARKQTTDLTLQLLQAEAAAQERVRQVAIKAIDDQVAAKTRAYDLELAAIDAIKGARDRAAKATEAANQKEVAALEVATKSIERQNGLLSARANLKKAQSDAATSETEIALAAVEQELQANQKDVGLLQQKAALETQLATQKRQALLDEQASARTSLQLEIKRNEIAGRRQLIEAQIAETKAKQSVLDAQSALQQQRINDQKAITQAQGELDKAQKLQPGNERDRAVADAQTKVQLVQGQAGQGQANAQQQVQLAQEQVELTGQNQRLAVLDVENTKQVNQLQAQTLEIEQETALKRFDATEALRQQRIEQEAIAVAANAEADGRERSAKAGGASPAALPARRLGGPVSPGQPFVGAEEGAEAVRYGDGSYGLLSVPGVYQVPRAGTVLTARQTAALMGGKAGVTVPKGMQAIAQGGGASFDGADLAQEVKGLRADLAQRGLGSQSNQFTIVGESDPYDRVMELQAKLRRQQSLFGRQ